MIYIYIYIYMFIYYTHIGRVNVQVNNLFQLIPKTCQREVHGDPLILSIES